MPKKKFDPTHYKKKKTVYSRLPNNPGINTIWDWSKRKEKYCRRTFGNKFYAVKRICGNQTAKCFAHLGEAKQWLNEFDGVEHENHHDLLFNDLLNRFFEKKESEWRVQTLETYQSRAKHLKYFLKIPVRSITPRVIDDWITTVKAPRYLQLQHKTRISYKKELCLLNQALTFYSDYLCDDNSYSIPIKKRHRADSIVDRFKYDQAKSKNSRKFLPRDVVYGFLGELKKRMDKKEQLEVLLMTALFQFSTGTRIGEACAIDWNDVCLEQKTALIHKNVCFKRKKGRPAFISSLTKTSDTRQVFLPQFLISELRKWCLKSGRSKGLILSYDGTTPLSYRHIQYHYDRALKAVSSDWRGTHIMRHSFATDFLEKTQNPKALQGLLGHRSAQQTNHYAKVTNTLMQRGMDQYEESFIDIAKIVSR